MGFIYKSYAKINLFLHVIGKRNDGYHLLESLVTFCDLHDILNITITTDTQSTLEINGEFSNKLLNQNQNLILQAFALLKSKYHIPYNIKVYLNKNIPLGAGLGGGSSNAAITLLACNQIFNLQLSLAKLANYATTLGADVPVCLNQPQCAFIEGIGEVVTPLISKQKFYIILINPNIHINTQQIFKLFSLHNIKNKIAKEELFTITNTNTLLSYINQQNNSLETIAINFNNKIKYALDLLQSTKPLFSRMTGSGSTCFALYNNLAARDSAFAKLANYKTNLWIKKSTIWLP